MSSPSRIAQTLLSRTRSANYARSISSTASRIRLQKSFSFAVHNRDFAIATRRPLTTTRTLSNTSSKMGVHNIANKAEFNEALKNEVVVLDCFATWCGPCKVIAPQVVKYSEEFPNAHFIKVDVDEVPDVAQELGIRAMPTFILFKNGDKVAEVVGANPPALRKAIEQAIAA